MPESSSSAHKTDKHRLWLLRSIFLSALAIYGGTWMGYYLFSRGLDPVSGSIARL
jgi:hypothetical protein